MRPTWTRLERGRAADVWGESADRFRSNVVGPHLEWLCREHAIESGHELFGEPIGEVSPGVVPDAALDQTPAELAGPERLAVEHLPDRALQLARIGALHATAKGAAVGALDHALHERPDQEGVGHRDEMNRAPQQREPDRLAIGEHPPQLVRVEALDARPEPVVGRQHGLRLEADEALDDIADAHVGGAAQQELALEKSPVQRAPSKHLLAPGHRRHHAGAEA
jgi:hypothetical protein